MTIDLKDIQEKISDSPHGCFCTFIRLDEKWGLKLYESRGMRDRAIEFHEDVIFAGFLAPEIKGKIDLEEIGYFGYIVEIVEVFYNPQNLEEKIEKRIFAEKNYAKERDELVELMEKAGVEYSDYHWGNFGLKNGKLVPIDFY